MIAIHDVGSFIALLLGSAFLAVWFNAPRIGTVHHAPISAAALFDFHNGNAMNVLRQTHIFQAFREHFYPAHGYWYRIHDLRITIVLH